MSTNADLAAWGEPAATAKEEALAEFLDTVLEKLGRGEEVSTTQLLFGTPDLLERGEQLVRYSRPLNEAATRVWEHLTLCDDTTPSPAEASQPVRQAAAGETWPDPFPTEFRVQRLLGSGSFGEVWLADDLHLGRPVALKMLRVPDPSAARALAVLRNDARLLATMRHPNIVQVYAWRQAPAPDGERPCLVLQYVAGGSLADLVEANGPLSWLLAGRYIADVAEGLGHVHARGVIHRDVKPGNILWDPEADEALLTDFGVSARLVDASGMAGTLPYMAPEAFRNRVTPASDVYSLAATFFRLVTGTVPFPAGTIDDLLRQIERGLPNPDPRCTGLPAPLERLTRVALAAEPERRPALSEFAAELRGTLNRLLADSLTLHPTAAPHAPPVDLRLIVSRQVGASRFEPVASTSPQPERFLRDLRRVPQSPDQVRLRLGDRVRLEVRADRAGFVVVFNVGPTGNLNLLYPMESAGGETPRVEAHRPLHILDVELTPPAGRERLIAIWSREPLPLRLEELRSPAESGELPATGPYRATRDMVRVQQSLRNLRPEDRHTVVLELDHC
jgi:serine/threonine protein kinase